MLVYGEAREIGQLFLSQNFSYMMVHASILNQEKLCELLVMTIIMYDLPFQFIEYEGIREIFTYLCGEVKHIIRITVKTYVCKMGALFNKLNLQAFPE